MNDKAFAMSKYFCNLQRYLMAWSCHDISVCKQCIDLRRVADVSRSFGTIFLRAGRYDHSNYRSENNAAYLNKQNCQGDEMPARFYGRPWST